MYSDDSDFFVPETVRPKPSGPTRWYRRWWGKVIIVFLVVLGVLGSALGFYFYTVSTQLSSGTINLADVLGPKGLPITNVPVNALATNDDPSVGLKNAKVTIVEFADFQCPYCEQMFPVVEQMLRDYGTKVRFIFRDFPLTDVHPQSVVAAEAARCAFEQGKFWEMHDKIFGNQNDLSETAFKTYAVQIGLNTDQFDTCYSSNKYLPKIESNLQDGYAAGVRATPTFFINDKVLEGAVPLGTLESVIISELGR